MVGGVIDGPTGPTVPTVPDGSIYCAILDRVFSDLDSSWIVEVQRCFDATPQIVMLENWEPQAQNIEILEVAELRLPAVFRCRMSLCEIPNRASTTPRWATWFHSF